MRRGDLLGRFEVLEDLGAGGMSQVFLASDGESGEKVALKVLHAHHVSDPNVVPRFVREAETYRKLRHPNIVRYVGSGVQDSTYYIAVEHVEGRSLEELLAKRKTPFGPRRSLLVGIDLLRALEHAHSRGIIHRDLKPQNVMISQQGAVKLLDFGVARADDRLVQTSQGDLLGSFLYSAPEQNRGLAVDATADLYSFGLILWEMLTGQRALDGHMLEVLKRQQNEAIRTPSSLNPAVPPGLDGICKRLLRADPAQRYPSAVAALEDLVEFQEMAGLA